MEKKQFLYNVVLGAILFIIGAYTFVLTDWLTYTGWEVQNNLTMYSTLLIVLSLLLVINKKGFEHTVAINFSALVSIVLLVIGLISFLAIKSNSLPSRFSILGLGLFKISEFLYYWETFLGILIFFIAIMILLWDNFPVWLKWRIKKEEEKIAKEKADKKNKKGGYFMILKPKHQLLIWGVLALVLFLISAALLPSIKEGQKEYITALVVTWGIFAVSLLLVVGQTYDQDNKHSEIMSGITQTNKELEKIRGELNGIKKSRNRRKN